MDGEGPGKRNRVLFLCTGNSARSQMAEAIVNARLGARWQAFSAGTQPARSINPLARQALAEIGIEHAGRPKSTEEFRGQDFDLVVTLCDDAAENCPVWLGKGKRVHLGFPDPVEMEDFRKIRDTMAAQVMDLLRKEG